MNEEYHNCGMVGKNSEPTFALFKINLNKKMRKSLLLLIALVPFLANAQSEIFGLNDSQVFYSFEKGEVARMKLAEWDIAIEPAGDYAIRINEASGTRAWVKTDDLRENCDLGLVNCRGLQDYEPENYDTTGMRMGQDSWVEVHNSYTDWKMGAMNQEGRVLSTDLSNFGWGGYKGFTSSPLHAILGYHIFIVQLRNGEYKQFFVRKSLEAGFEFAYSNLDGSDVREYTINRADSENKLFQYVSLINHKTFSPEPNLDEWDFVATPFPDQKANGNTEVKIGFLANPVVSASEIEDNPACASPTTYNTDINAVGNRWNNYNGDCDCYVPRENQTFFTQRDGNDLVQLTFLEIDNEFGDIKFVANTWNIGEMTSVNSKSDETCFNCNNGTASVEAFGGSCPYTISWDNGSIEFEQSNLEPGTYNYTVSDDQGNSTTGSVTIDAFECELSIANADIVNVNCFEGNDGSISLTVTGENGNVSYDWNGFGNGSTIEDLSSGTYTVKISDDKNCKLEETFQIDEPVEIQLVTIVNNESCGLCEDGSISVSVSGGVPTYSFAWADTSLTTADRSDLAPGVYSLTVTDANGCEKKVSLTIKEFGCILGFNRPFASNPSCYGFTDGFIMTDVAGAVGEVSYNWSNGETSENLENIGAGVYSIVITDEKGCKDSLAFELTEPDSISLDLNVISDATCDTCKDGKIEAFVEGGTKPYTYSWSNDSTSANIDFLNPGNYTLTVIDANACEKTATAEVLNTVGVRETVFNNLKLYPNPASNVLNFNKVVDEVVIYSLQGKKLLEKTYTNIIDISELTNGNYLVEVKLQSHIKHYNIMKL